MRLHFVRAHDASNNTVGQTTFSAYDPLGRPLASSQVIVGAPDPFSFTNYTYDRAGNLKSVTYPSGRVVNMTYTVGGLIQSLAGVKDSVPKNYLTGPSYSPFGAITQATLGNGLIERSGYLNGLPQLWQLRLGDGSNPTLRGEWQFRYCDYGLGPYFRADSCSANNGNVLGQSLNVGGALYNQTYKYDDVNRLCSVNETILGNPLAPRSCASTGATVSNEQWYQTFAYDRWGNLATPTDPNVNVHPLTVRSLGDYDTATNRLKTLSGNFNYDSAGNLTKHGAWTLAYDAENRMKTSQPSSGVVTTYVYDGAGQRIKKTTNGVSTYFVYDAFGNPAAEYGGPAPTETGTHYLTTDHLGSTRLVTRQDGTAVSRHDYLPYGWELYAGVSGRTAGQGYLTNPETTPTPSQRFTGKERDAAETGLDYFGARYFSSGQGRFTSVDPKLSSGRPEDPQSWNRYPYSGNNPLRTVDPDGRDGLEAWVERARSWFRTLVESAAEVASNQVEAPGDTPSGPGFDDRQVVQPHADLVGKGVSLLKDIVSPADITGAGSIFEAGMRGNGPETMLAMGAAAIPGGSGPRGGILEVGGAFKSSKAVQNYSGKAVEFVFDIASGRFVMGAMKHSELAKQSGIATGSETVAGMIGRVNGKLTTNEISGTFWRNWTDERRKKFVQFMKSHGVQVTHGE